MFLSFGLYRNSGRERTELVSYMLDQRTEVARLSRLMCEGARSISVSSKMAEAFISFCEAFWHDWLAGTLKTPPFIHGTFGLDNAPEAYISFDSGASPLIALMTNPGATTLSESDDGRCAGVIGGWSPEGPMLTYPPMMGCAS